jgi:hypothetical protein
MILVGKRKGKNLLGRPRLRREDTVKMDLREVSNKLSDSIKC